MMLTIQLTPTQEAKLQVAARKSATDPTEFVRRLVEDLPSVETEPAGSSKALTLADALHGRVGRLRSGGKREGKPFVDHLAEKHEATRF